MWMHVCRPPRDQPPGTVWACPDCRYDYQYGPVIVSELGGRVMNLWVTLNPRADPEPVPK